MIIKSVVAKPIKDSRGDKTISVEIKTNCGKFSSSSPTGKSTGKYEARTYKESLPKDIETLIRISKKFEDFDFKKFGDLKFIEKIAKKKIGANTLFALEGAILKAIAKEKKIEVWELINSRSKKFPRLVGNCVGGGKHSHGKKVPDFQEFEIIPQTNSPKEAYEINLNAKLAIGKTLPRIDINFHGKKNDENAWVTTLNENKIFEILSKINIPLGSDIAASGFYVRKKYAYKNPVIFRTKEEQLVYLENLMKKYPLFYVEDPFSEDDFESFSKLLKKFPNRLIVGDDLTVTNYKKLQKAIKLKSINGIIVKPNQCGSLLEVKKVVKLAKENNIKIIFSHRSGETSETILADLAFGFGADFFKCGIEGDARIKKIKRLIEIEKTLKRV